MTIKEILNRIDYTVIINGEEKPGNILYGTWMDTMVKQSEKASGYKPEKEFDPVARDNFQQYIALAYYAGLLPAKVIETRTDEIKDGAYVFTVETIGTLTPETTEATTEAVETTENQNTNNTNTKEDNTMNTFINDIKTDIITRLEDMQGSTQYLCDLGFELTMDSWMVQQGRKRLVRLPDLSPP